MVTHSNILAWEIPWTEEPVRLQLQGHKELDMTEHTHHHNKGLSDVIQGSLRENSCIFLNYCLLYVL